MSLLESSMREPQKALSDMLADPFTLTEQDLDEIWTQRSSVPESIEGCIHGLITQVAQQQPAAPAVHAWDGQFSYSQLDALASKLARRLSYLDANPGQVIPILFEKTKWTAVAMLGIIKSGNACVALDTTQPDARLRSIVQQTQARTIVTSRANHSRASKLADVTKIQLDDALFDVADDSTQHIIDSQLPTISPADTAYISFTSGTTGIPKGACISHANVRSAIYHQGQKLGFTNQSRVLDFAPYSFDVAWSNFLHTLGAGGCICIAQQEHMLNDLSSAITAFKATLINVTPTVLRTIHPIPESLDTVLLSGEMPFRENIVQWSGRVRLLNTYGPTECTFKCAFSVLEPRYENRPDIGVGVGFCTWLVDPNDSTKLADMGSVGELYLEGPLVGQGYLSDPVMTAFAFVQDPPWLITGHGKFAGRTGRLYKTGDLVRYKQGGRMLFVGRRDTTQLKIRGQRAELGDVEHHVHACMAHDLPLIADIVHPTGSKDPSLSLFVQTHGHNIEMIRTSIRGLAKRLFKVLPSFMIPTLFIPIDKIPLTSTGKTDRQRLREWGNSLSWVRVLELQSILISAPEHCEPTNEMEHRLRQIWALILNLDVASLSITDNFFQKGGDSVAAIFMVASARKENLLLTVADIIRTPKLSDLARATKFHDLPPLDESIAPFSLLKGEDDKMRLRRVAARLCKVDMSEIEDIYPCTPLQEGMLAMTVKNAGDYVSRRAFILPEQIDKARFEHAWNEVVSRTPILRTRIVNLSGEGIVQVVLRSSVAWNSHLNVRSFLGGEEPMVLGKPLWRAGLIQDDQWLFCLDIHHAIFDGWCIELILDSVEEIYRDVQSMDLRRAPFQLFVKHVLARNSPTAVGFWQHQLAGSEASVFPSSNYNTQPKKDFKYRMSHLQWSRTRFTSSSVIRSAIAILLASYTNSNDVIFGATTSGRQAPIPNIEHIVGPTIATTPVRVKLDWHQTVEQLERQIQDQAIDIVEHEQYGLQQIRRISQLLRDASEFQILLMVQQVIRSRSHQGSGLFIKPVSISNQGVVEAEADVLGIYNSFAMLVICQLEVDGLILKINHDPGAIHEQQVHRFAQQLETLLQQLCSEECQHSQLRELTLVSDHDLSSMWEWNKCVPDTFLKPVVISIDEHAMNRPDSPAISAWDKSLSYKQLKELSCCLAYRLQQEGIGMESIVLLSLEKSAWMAVLMIAVLRIGATVLPLSAISSTYDAQELMTTLRPKLAITSVAPESSPFHSLVPIIHISELVRSLDKANKACLTPLHMNELSDSAVILFTSGSTGAAKGILWSHGTVSSNVNALNASFGLTAESRVFQFSDYEYDVSNLETFATLSVGGCLCIPTGSDRLNRLAAAIHHTGANWICLTPSVAETLSPGEVPLLKTLVCAGEMLHERTALKWVKGVKFFYNWYGPAEAAVATSCIVRESTWRPGFIGQGSHALGWLVNPKDHDRLALVGAIAELCIEGPILAAGYIGKTGQALNQNAFVSPPWLQRGHSDIRGRVGKIYKTGDLVKYDAYGRLIIIGRSKDSERKLHGRRVDLGEIENRVQPALSGKIEATVVAEIFSPAKSTNETLALFVKPVGVLEDSGEDVEVAVKQLLPVDHIEETLLRTLPSYLIPKLYVPIANIPLTHAGKTDRRRLRQIGSSFTHEQLAKMQPSRNEVKKPSTEMEKRLQGLWAEIIGIEPEGIFSEDSFLQVGGDSVGAMRLVALAYDQGFILTFADIFAFPRLSRMAEVIKEDSPSANKMTPAPFSLLHPGISRSEAQLYAARLCHVSASQVVDIYPCTALQEGLLAMTARRSGQYVSRSILRLQDSIDPDRLRRAWQTTVDRFPILRTRVVDIPGQGLVQVVLSHLNWRCGADIDIYVREDECEPMGLATELCRAAVISQHFILTIHHCLYDGNVLEMILDEVEALYVGKTGMLITPFQDFIQHLTKVDEEKVATFWRQELLNSELSQFPTVPSQRYEPVANKEIQHSILLDWPRSEMTPSTIIRSAWAILAAVYTSSDDVVFGATVSGRQVDMRGILNCVGPTISSVPIAITISGDETVSELQARVQRQTLAMTPYEQYGLRNIQHASGRVKYPLFQTLLVVQPVPEGKSLNEDSLLFKARTFASNIDTRGTDPFNTYPLMLICELSRSGFSLRMSYDDRILEPMVTQRIAHQFEKILRQMCMEHAATTKVKDLQTASDADVEFFWNQNAEYPEEPTLCVQDLITKMAKKRPNAVAVDAHDGKFTYHQVDELSNVITQNLMKLGLKQGFVIALCLDKSRWAPIAQLAILKAGGICLLQTALVIGKSLDYLFSSVNVCIVLVLEASHVDIVEHSGIRSFTIQQIIDRDLAQQMACEKLPTLRMSDPAALLLSSGSTGEPKRILWSHRTLAANVKALVKAALLNEASRVFQFTSYNFDVCTIEMVTTLAQGGCLCIPSESERLDSLAQAVQRFHCDFICLTPSTAKLLQPGGVPCLNTLGFGGEILVEDEVARWKGKIRLLNWYGPCENSTATFSAADDEAWRSGVIGRSNSSASSRCWLVNPKNYNNLVPWGAIGEIAIEGTARAECYLENCDLTTPRRNQIYLTGDLARCRSNGDLEFMRRKDTLFKIRGNLVAPETVEHHIHQCLAQHNNLEVVAEIIKLKGGCDLTLVAFLCFPKVHEISRLDMEEITYCPGTQSLVSTYLSNLSQ
jgi:amino acid adenylation domain-containing protein